MKKLLEMGEGGGGENVFLNIFLAEESSSSDQWVRMFWTRIQHSQDHLVCLQWLTILTGQGHISDLLVYPKTLVEK